MNDLNEFYTHHGKPTDCIQPSEDQSHAYTGLLPDALIKQWRETGWCNVGDGFIWLVDPDPFHPILRYWIEEEDAFVFARTGFGNLFVYRNKSIGFLNVHFGQFTTFPVDFITLFNQVMIDPEFINDVLDKKLFDVARQKLGTLESDECYSFNPALALGGDKQEKHLIKVKMLPQLLILSQVHG